MAISIKKMTSEIKKPKMNSFDSFHKAEKEIMDDYGYSGNTGRIKIRFKFLKTWILHSIAYSSPHPSIVIRMQRSRGVKIGKNCYFSPYVLIDLMYPHLISIGDNVSIGSNTMIFAHANMSTNKLLHEKIYPRTTSKVKIESGAWINPGCIITHGVTIGENSVLAVGSVVSSDVPKNCVVAGNPARVIKKLS